MSTYELLAAAIRSGQCTAAQIVKHMENQEFAVWYARRYG